ncbi:hypothetical protein ACFO0N_15690 [Halobium salinum]|uniref:Uncharacterized protein n=1 Tax=Halobium salinum TaxID=1364940 RepID=A0ABD5PEN4_9EURY|nr:hypothetical protein [Halobium salinum]
MSGTLAVDIETVSPGREPRGEQFRDSTFFELLAVGLGHRPAPGEPVETTVRFREDDTPESELALLDAVCDWAEKRDPDSLLTYNGTGFDFLHLPGRADLAGEEVGDAGPGDRLDALLALPHDDLMDDVREAWGHRLKLGDACAELGIDCPETLWADYETGLDPETWRFGRARGAAFVTNSDVPQVGERYLALASVDARETLTFRELHGLLEHYTVADIEPLYELADRRPFAVE